MSEIRVNTITSAEGTSAPTMTYGFQVPTGMGITGAGGVNITGVVTATSFSGDGSALTGIAATENVRTGSLTVAGVSTLTGAVNVDATTDSTSTTTGALIVDGGAAIAKNVYIGAGLSVAGTLTYEDVTSVDSVGMVTAKSGVNVSGGQLQVGVAYSVGAAGVATALGFVAGTSGLSGTLQTAAQTNITSLGSLSALTVTGDVTLDNGTNAGKDLTWDASADSLIFNDTVYAKFGTGSDMYIYHDGSNGKIVNNTGSLTLNATSSEAGVDIAGNGAVQLYYDGNSRLATTNEGAKITGFTSTTAGLGVTGGMWEGAFIKAGKLSDNLQIGISTSNIHVFTTTETTTATPNIKWNDSYALSSKMAVGDAVTVTIVTTAASAGYAAAITIDGNAVTEEWNGGSAPSAGSSGGYDVYTYTLIRKATGTGDTGWICLANVSNFA